MKFEFDIKKVDLVTLGGVDLRKNFQGKMKKNFEQFLGETIYNSTVTSSWMINARLFTGEKKWSSTSEKKSCSSGPVKAIEFEPGLIGAEDPETGPQNR